MVLTRLGSVYRAGGLVVCPAQSASSTPSRCPSVSGGSFGGC
jgi:hypothetical protein